MRHGVDTRDRAWEVHAKAQDMFAEAAEALARATSGRSLTTSEIAHPPDVKHLRDALGGHPDPRGTRSLPPATTARVQMSAPTPMHVMNATCPL
jgi:hypothetical protein